MNEAALVADCVKAMSDAVSIPVTVKHRIGVDQIEHYGFLAEFVDTIAAAGCTTFIVHARNAILKGLSPKENREIPPLKYDYVPAETRTPELEIPINGGVRTLEDIDNPFAACGRRDDRPRGLPQPYLMAAFDARYYGDDHPIPSREDILAAITPYIARELADGNRMNNLTRHIPGLYPPTWRPTLSPTAVRQPPAGRKRWRCCKRHVRLRAESMKHHRLTCPSAALNAHAHAPWS